MTNASPGLSWSGRNANWRAPKRYVAAGYTPKNVKLEPGHRDDEFQAEREAICRKLTADMHEWWSARGRTDTWGDLIERYRTDEYSPITDVKATTREGYEYLLDHLSARIGPIKVDALGYPEIRAFRSDMAADGSTDAFIQRIFTMLRTVARYAAFAIRVDGAKEVSETLSAMRISSPAQRQVIASLDDITRIIAASDAAGNLPFSAGLLMQYEFSLRAVDVRGQWVPGDGAISRNGKHWRDGLTWNMFNRDCTEFTKTISKTAKSLPEPYTFSLLDLPELRERLMLLRPMFPAGPVIVSERTKLPFDRPGWASAFKRYRRAAGVSEAIKCMDLRASGISEAQSTGVDQFTLRDAAQHTRVDTTDRYVRDRSAAANKVVALRTAGRK